MEVPRLRAKSELQLPVYTLQPQKHWILNPLSESWNRTHILMDTSWVCYRWAAMGTPLSLKKFFLLLFFSFLATPQCKWSSQVRNQIQVEVATYAGSLTRYAGPGNGTCVLVLQKHCWSHWTTAGTLSFLSKQPNWMCCGFSSSLINWHFKCFQCCNKLPFTSFQEFEWVFFVVVVVLFLNFVVMDKILEMKVPD